MCKVKLIQLICVLAALLLIMPGCKKTSTGGDSDDDSIDNPENTFVAMAIARTITSISSYMTKIDMITARFDTSYAPCNPVTPVQANAVTCNEYTLEWNSDLSSHFYQDVLNNPEFISLGGEYIFNITENSNVPSFADTIDFPVNETYVTAPIYYEAVSLSGFNVEWESGNDAGTVYLILLDPQNDTALLVETNNDGTHTFNSAALSGMSPGQYGLLLIHENWDNITAEGIDPRSFIRARVINTTPINLH